MQEFRIKSGQVINEEYLVLKCPHCGRVQRFMHRQACFGKLPRNAGCKQCQKSFPLAENAMDNDPLPISAGEEVFVLKDGKWVPQPVQKNTVSAGFTTADRL